MIISFDLDDTIIPGVKRFPLEKRNWLHKVLGIEEMRAGTIQLMKQLRSSGHSIFIYTTSFRKSLKIRRFFLTYGVRVDKIINQQLHNKIVKPQKINCSKYPPAFGIDIHIDDSAGVAMEGTKHNFKTIIVAEGDADWVNTILKRLH